MDSAKGLVAELTPPHAQSACGFRGERVRTVGLAICCNYFSKKKKSMDSCWGCPLKLKSFVDENRNHLTTMEYIMINIIELGFGTSNKTLIHMLSSSIGMVDWDPSLSKDNFFYIQNLYSGLPIVGTC